MRKLFHPIAAAAAAAALIHCYARLEFVLGAMQKGPRAR
jgi:hypothetical protein